MISPGSFAGRGAIWARWMQVTAYSRRAVRRLMLLAVLAVLTVASGANFEFFGDSETASTRQLYMVTRSDSMLTVTARGTLQCQRQTEINCGVFNLGQFGGTQILKIVPNGASVAAGDVLIELDPAPVKEKLDEFRLRYEGFLARQIQAESQLKARKVQNATRQANAHRLLGGYQLPH